MTTLLTPHFSLEELGGVGPIPSAHRANLGRLAVLLEAFRKALGVPLQVTNGYDAPTVADPPGRVPNSQHKDGSAADVIPRGLTQLEAHRRIAAAEARGEIPDYGQLIFYPFKLAGAGSGHLHISLANRDKRRQQLVRLNETAADSAGQKYTTLGAAILARFPGAGSTAALVVVALIALLVYFILFAPEIARHG